MVVSDSSPLIGFSTLPTSEMEFKRKAPLSLMDLYLPR